MLFGEWPGFRWERTCRRHAATSRGWRPERSQAVVLRSRPNAPACRPRTRSGAVPRTGRTPAPRTHGSPTVRLRRPPDRSPPSGVVATRRRLLTNIGSDAACGVSRQTGRAIGRAGAARRFCGGRCLSVRRARRLHRKRSLPGRLPVRSKRAGAFMGCVCWEHVTKSPTSLHRLNLRRCWWRSPRPGR